MCDGQMIAREWSRLTPYGPYDLRFLFGPGLAEHDDGSVGLQSICRGEHPVLYCTRSRGSTQRGIWSIGCRLRSRGRGR